MHATTLAVDLGLDVPGDVTEARLMRAPKGETPAARWIRLAKLAIVQGCRLVVEERERGKFTVCVTSGTKANTSYAINLDAMRCECEAGSRCKHLALCLSALSLLPDERDGYTDRATALERARHQGEAHAA